MYIWIVSHKLGRTVYEATEVGYDLKFYKTFSGLEISLNGLSDKNIIFRLVSTIIDGKKLCNECIHFYFTKILIYA